MLALGLMARVLVTGSADGLGRLAAAALADDGHEVVLHARSPERAEQALAAVPKAKAAVAGDLSRLSGIRAATERAGKFAPFDAIIHNAGVYRDPGQRTEEGLPPLFVVNTLAPYVLTALLPRPQRLVFLTSGLHRGGDGGLEDLAWEKRRFDAGQAYADSKLHDVMLAFAAARLWPKVRSNAVNPGWVPTKMGGPGAPDDLDEGWRTQAWLAASPDAATITGKLFFHKTEQPPHPAARDASLQDRLLAECARLTGAAWR